MFTSRMVGPVLRNNADGASATDLYVYAIQKYLLCIYAVQQIPVCLFCCLYICLCVYLSIEAILLFVATRTANSID